MGQSLNHTRGGLTDPPSIPHNGFNGGQTVPPQPTSTMIATDFIDLCSNELWEELLWLQEQPQTKENCNLHNRIWAEICTREQRRQALQDNFAWG
jgi:hypothetical protein